MSDSNTQFGSTPAIFIVQRTTGRKFKLLESPVTNWIDQMPTDLAGEFAVSETSGSINGSVFGYWLGTRNVLDPEVQSAIHLHIADHDVSSICYIKADPTDVHPVIKTRYLQILANR